MFLKITFDLNLINIYKMKNISLLSIIVLYLTTFMVNNTSAQSFILRYNSQIIPNGDTIVISGDTSAILMANVDVENTSASDKTVEVSKTILYQEIIF